MSSTWATAVTMQRRPRPEPGRGAAPGEAGVRPAGRGQGRLPLGADGPRVVRLLVAGGLRLVVMGGALGLALAVVAARLLGGLLFEVDALDPLTFVGVPLVLGAAALLAAWLPARRASRVSPIVALRTD